MLCWLGTLLPCVWYLCLLYSQSTQPSSSSSSSSPSRTTTTSVFQHFTNVYVCIFIQFYITLVVWRRGLYGGISIYQRFYTYSVEILFCSCYIWFYMKENIVQNGRFSPLLIRELRKIQNHQRAKYKTPHIWKTMWNIKHGHDTKKNLMVRWVGSEPNNLPQINV